MVVVVKGGESVHCFRLSGCLLLAVFRDALVFHSFQGNLSLGIDKSRVCCHHILCRHLRQHRTTVTVGDREFRPTIWSGFKSTQYDSWHLSHQLYAEVSSNYITDIARICLTTKHNLDQWASICCIKSQDNTSIEEWILVYMSVIMYLMLPDILGNGNCNSNRRHFI